MGSWARSLHVKHTDADAVQNAVRMLLLGQGYREMAIEKPKLVSVANLPESKEETTPAGSPPPDVPNYVAKDEDWEELDDDFEDKGDEKILYFPDVMTPQERSICVFRSRGGWVGVLDSGDAWELAPLVSAQLHTDTLLVLVNDSDSWLFDVHRSGLPFDDFDSAGSSGDEDGVSPELQAAMDRGDEEAIERELLKNAPQGPIHMPDGSAMPFPELALLGARIKAGQATFWQRCRYWWLFAKFMFQLLTGRWQANPIDIGFDIPRETPLDAETLRRHIERLQAIFPRADKKALRDLLPLNRFPSEELLRKFLAILGLPGFYAYLSYDYLDDHTREELQDEGIVWAGEMRFTNRSEP